MLPPRMTLTRTRLTIGGTRSTTITPETKNASGPTPPNIVQLNQIVNAQNKQPNPQNYGSQGPTSQLQRPRIDPFKLFAIRPDLPTSPRRDTAVVEPFRSISVVDQKARIAASLTAKRGPAGTPPPTNAERTTHISIPEWNKAINAIPPESRSVSPALWATQPRIDQSSPTLYGGPVAAAMARDAYPYDPLQSGGLQTDDTDTGPSAFSVLMFCTVAAFGAFFLLRGR